MKRLVIALSVGLGCSVLLNVWQWFNVQQHRYVSSPAINDSNHQASNVIDPTQVQQGSPHSGENPLQDVPLLDNTSYSLEQLSALLAQERYSQLAQILREQLRVTPNDVALLLLEAELYYHTQPLADALVNYYSLLDVPMSDNEYGYLQDKITTLFTTASEQLKQDDAWDILAQLLEPLFQIQPENKSYVLTLAEAYGYQKKYTLMEDVLASLPPDDLNANAIRDLAYGPKTVALEPNTDIDPFEENDPYTAIELTYIRNQYLIDTRFNGQNARLLIDTGATTTAITPALFSALKQTEDTEFIGVFTVNTAGGRVQAPMIRVKQFYFGPYIIEDLTVLVMPTDTLENAEGLLGMNVLKLFDFRLDQESVELKVKAR